MKYLTNRLDTIISSMKSKRVDVSSRVAPYSPDNIEIFGNLGSQIIGKEYIIDERNISLINNLLLYIHNQPGEYDLNKGLFVHGNIGSGKTLLMRTLATYSQGIINGKQFRMVPTMMIYDGYEMEGREFMINLYKGNLCVDDLDEFNREIGHYNNRAKPILDLLMRRYNEWIERGILTHITTNLNSSLIGEIYSERLNSRLFEMFNDIKLIGDDWRKAKV